MCFDTCHRFKSERAMQRLDLKDMSLDELWTLHERISNLLSARILAEKRELEKRLAY
jgi:DNA-binding protein H-NS